MWPDPDLPQLPSDAVEDRAETEPWPGLEDADPQESDENLPLDDEELKDESERSDEPLAYAAPFPGLYTRGPTSFGDGPVANRDNTFNYYGSGFTASSAPLSGVVPASKLEQLASTYVEVTAIGHLSAGLKLHRVQVLSGLPGTGRTTTALMALHRLGGPVHLVDSPDDLRSIAEPGLPGPGSYAMELQEPLLNSAWLNIVRATLERTGAHLILVLDDTTPSLQGLDEEYVVRYSPPPSMAVLDRYLEQAPGKVCDRIREELRDQTELGKAVQDEVRQALGPAHVVGIVAKLVAAFRDGSPPPEGIIDDFGSKLRMQVRSWLLDGSPPNVPQRTVWEVATLLACCVFNEYPVGRVMPAAESLAKRLADLESAGTPLQQPVLRDSLRASDGFVRITKPHEHGTGWYAQLHTPRVQVLDSRLPAILFEVVWRELGAVRVPLVGWLRELSMSVRSEPLQGPGIRAIDAIGLLAQVDIDFIYREVLSRWASSGRRIMNLAVVRVLEVASGDERVLPSLRRALRTWSRNDAAPGRRQTVLLACNSPLLAARLSATEVLRATKGVPALLRPEAARLLAAFVVKGHAGLVLADLTREVGDGDTEAMSRFLLLAAETGPEADVPDPRAAFLIASAAATEPAQALAELWRVALHNSNTVDEAWRCLRGWVALADGRVSLLEPLGALMDRLMTAPRLAARVPFMLRLWQSRPGPPDQAAQCLLAHLAHQQRGART